MGPGGFLQAIGLSRDVLAGSVWLVGDLPSIDLAYPAVNDALAQRSEENLVIWVPAEELATARRRYSHEMVLACPKASVLQRRTRRAQPLLVIQVGDAHWPIWSDVPQLRVQLPQTLAPDDVLAALPRSRSRPARPYRMLDRFAAVLVRSVAGAPIATIAELRARLGAPSTLVCLGNGPSSEDPQLAQFQEACFFRVNWTWRERSILTWPQLVFTADPDLPDRSHQPIIAFPRRDEGFAILAGHIFRLRPPHSGYYFCDASPPTATDIGPGLIPTNGALMIAVAAALQPQRIVIAGIDLYRHPAGRYPGWEATVDGYARAHSRDRDLDLIRRSLVGFAGELIVFGDALNQALMAT